MELIRHVMCTPAAFVYTLQQYLIGNVWTGKTQVDTVSQHGVEKEFNCLELSWLTTDVSNACGPYELSSHYQLYIYIYIKSDSSLWWVFWMFWLNYHCSNILDLGHFLFFSKHSRPTLLYPYVLLRIQAGRETIWRKNANRNCNDLVWKCTLVIGCSMENTCNAKNLADRNRNRFR